jgi:hypothetical protein
VMDINPGLAGAFPSEFAQLGNTLFFTANDGIHGTELWSLEGTTPFLQDGQLPDIQFDNFSSLAGLVLNGNAQPFEGVLRLTPDRLQQAGSAFYDQAFTFEADTSFETDFEFKIDNGQRQNGADGFVWVVQSSPSGSAALGGRGGGLGYSGIGHSLAIEFDTYANDWEKGNHVAVLLNGDVRSPLVSATPSFDLNDGNSGYAWITYDGTTDLLEVYVSNQAQKPGTALLSTTLDLESILGSAAHFGFTAATGGLTNTHDILNWQLDILDGALV